MTICIPLCWKGRRVYNPVNDEYRGGWLWFGLRIRCSRIWPNCPRGFQVTCKWQVGLKP